MPTQKTNAILRRKLPGGSGLYAYARSRCKTSLKETGVFADLFTVRPFEGSAAAHFALRLNYKTNGRDKQCDLKSCYGNFEPFFKLIKKRAHMDMSSLFLRFDGETLNLSVKIR